MSCLTVPSRPLGRATRVLVEPVDETGGWPVASYTERERLDGRRLWAAVMLTNDLAVCQSILLGRRVMARQLDGEALRRALRGAPLPNPRSYIEVTAAMLDAVAEGGAFTPVETRKR